MIIIIPTADDSNSTLRTEIEFFVERRGQVLEDTATRNISLSSGKDPIHSGLCQFWNDKISCLKESYNKEIEVNVSGYALFITKDKNYKINGRPQTLSNICHIMGRLTYASINDKDRKSIRDKFDFYCTTPNDVIYALENKTPYHWFEDGKKIDVRLNTKKISPTEIALEISDGVWGDISIKDLNKYLGFYLHNRKQSKWKFMSPTKLYFELIGKEPTESELELMVAFLSQNRTSVIVEERAKELLKSMSKQYSNRMHMETIDDLICIRVKGQDHEWLLVERANVSFGDRQKVNTYVLGVEKVNDYCSEDTDNTVIVKEMLQTSWRGPICIDNMTSGSSLGDQFASRIFAVMNDSMTVSRVSTLSHYIKNIFSVGQIALDEGLDSKFVSNKLYSTTTTTTTIVTTTVVEEEFK